MHQYHKYTFLISVEFDARLVGHWGSFFNASLLQAEQSRGVDLWSGHDSQLTAGHAANLTGPGTVDLITYGPLAYSKKWRHSSTHLDLVNSWDICIKVRFPLELGLAACVLSHELH